MRCPDCHTELSLETVRTRMCAACALLLTHDEFTQYVDEVKDSGQLTKEELDAILAADPSSSANGIFPIIDMTVEYDSFADLDDLSATLPNTSQTVDFSPAEESVNGFAEIESPDGDPAQPNPPTAGNSDPNRAALDSGESAPPPIRETIESDARDANTADPNAATLDVGNFGSALFSFTGEPLIQGLQLPDVFPTVGNDVTVDQSTLTDGSQKATLDSATFAAGFAAIPPEDKPAASGPKFDSATIDSATLDSATLRELAKSRGEAGGEGPPTSDSQTANDQDDDEGTFDERRLAATYDSGLVSESQGAQIAGLWRGTIAPTTTPRMTIKRDRDGGSPKDSKLVIKPKDFTRKRQTSSAALKPPVKSNADYELLDVIGEGGVGVVYEARQASIDRTVAVKMLKPAGAKNADQREKFLSEAVVTGDLDHPNIVPIYDLGTNETGALFYSMKRVQGTPWNKVIGQNSMVENLEILLKVADAVGFAHARGVIHRDLKPENTMLGEFGEVLVMDWGLAVATANFRKVGTITQTTSMGGTPAYMAPEMAAGPVNIVSSASDIYLLGALLYEILTGQPPHTGKTVMKCLMAAARNEIAPTEHKGELIEIARRAMATKPADRYASVREFQNALRDYESHSESIALSARADEELIQARTSGDYQIFSRALFGFEEAAALWSGNPRVQQGVAAVRLAYAEAATAKSDFDLADSLLDADETIHRDLKLKVANDIRERNARQQRLKMARRMMLGMAATIAVLIVGALGWVNHEKELAIAARDQEEIARKDAVKQKERAEEQEALAVKAGRAESAAKEVALKAKAAAELSAEEEKKAKIAAEKSARDEAAAKQLALDAKDAAEKSALAEKKAKETAVLAQQEAVRAQGIAEKAKAAEEYESYIATIGLAAVKVQENAFGDVVELLEQCPPEYRNWEWYRLKSLCNRAAAEFMLRPPEPAAAARALLPAEIDAVAVSHDGKWLAAGTWNGKVLLWETAQPHKAVRTLDFGGDYVHALAWSHDGTILAVAGSDPRGGHVKLFDPVAGKPLRAVPGHTDAVLGVAFSRDDKQLLTTGYDRTARITRLDGSQPPRALKGHSLTVCSAAWSPREDAVVTAGQDGVCIVWDLKQSDVELQSPQNRKLFRAHAGPVYSAAFSPDGNSIVSAGYDRRVLVWPTDQARPVEFEKLAAGQTLEPPRYRELAGHTGPVRTAQFFPGDNRRVLSAAQDNTLKLWDAVTGELIQTLRGHSGKVAGAAFLANGQGVISGGHDRRILQWDISGYEEQRVLKGKLLAGHTAAILAADLSRDGRWIATAGQDRSAKLWSAADGNLVQTLAEGHEFLTTGVALFSDGKRFATSAVDNTTRIWDLTAGIELHCLQKTGQSAVVAVSRDGAWLATGGDEPIPGAAAGSANRPLVQIWNTQTGERRFALAGQRGQVTAAAFSPGDKFLATADSSGRLIAWNPANGEIVWRADRHSDAVVGLAWSADGEWLYSASEDETVGCARAGDGREEENRIWRHPAGVTALAIAADESRALTAAADSKVRVWNPRAAKLLFELPPLAGRVTGLAVSADGTRGLTVSSLASEKTKVQEGKVPEAAIKGEANSASDAAQQCVVQQFDLATGREIPERRMAKLLWGVTFGPDGESVLTVGGNGAWLWQPGQAAPTMSFTPHGAVSTVRISPDGQSVLTGSWDNSLKLWHRESGRTERKLPAAHRGPVNGAAWSPDGARFLTVSDDQTALVWNAASGAVEQTLRGHTARVRAGVFFPGGRHAITVGDDAIARIWDVAAGNIVRELPAAAAPLTSVAIQEPLPTMIARAAPEKLFFVIGSADNTARLWEYPPDHPEQAAPRAELTGHTAAVTCVDVSADGQRVLTGSIDATVKLWDTRVADKGMTKDAEKEAQKDAANPAAPPAFPKAKEILSLTGHTQEVTAVAFSRVGRRVLSASKDGTAILWLAE